MNINNLKRMYNHILTVPEELLSMVCFREEEEQMFVYECQTIGCVIGHCVWLDTYIVKRFSDDEIDFHGWSEDFLEIESESLTWKFLFSGNWATSPETNCKSQILARLKEFIVERNLGFSFLWKEDYDYIVTNPKFLDQTPFEI